MGPLARRLSKLGYRAQTWGEGLNLGTSPELMERLVAKLEKLRNETGMQVSLVGWSLGGIMSRKLAVKGLTLSEESSCWAPRFTGPRHLPA